MQSSSKIVVILLTLALSACSSLKNRDTSAAEERSNPKDLFSRPDLEEGEVAGLSIKNNKKRIGELYRPTQLSALQIPPSLVSSTTDSVLDNVGSGLELQNVLPEAITARIIKDGDNRWLEIDTSVEQAWQAMVNYWQLSGIELVEFNPQTGIMETDWVTQRRSAIESRNTLRQITTNIATSISKRNTILNKYRLRFERVNDNQSQMFVMIQSIERKAIERAKKLSEFAWVSADEPAGNQAKINEFLQNIVLVFDQ